MTNKTIELILAYLSPEVRQRFDIYSKKNGLNPTQAVVSIINHFFGN